MDSTQRYIWFSSPRGMKSFWFVGPRLNVLPGKLREKGWKLQRVAALYAQNIILLGSPGPLGCNDGWHNVNQRSTPIYITIIGLSAKNSTLCQRVILPPSLLATVHKFKSHQ
ncbi:hypothetical protein Moror_2087 [Moniliophthora roreri MCA 2997]|uniref:Uncharacterized protein n=1 Tax=Moniliophthora roreri (strain MCA 2997) TaxID=1381753 RepID=V2WT85_MONRO|nr:hypothetical protein Moror_2087 [Moniliophthora roreri MCA 2997]